MRIRILATSDVHGVIYPYEYASGAEKPWGMSRLSSLIKELRDEHTILVDNGDTLEGSPLSFYHDSQRHGQLHPMTRVLNALDYDFVNLGNHDFDYGLDVLNGHLDALTAPCVTTNIVRETAGARRPDASDSRFQGSVTQDVKVQGTASENSETRHLTASAPLGSVAIRTVAGKKIAFFGLCTAATPRWENSEKTKGLRFESALDVCERTVRELRETVKPDYIVCMYHGGFEADPGNLWFPEVSRDADNLAYPGSAKNSIDHSKHDKRETGKTETSHGDKDSGTNGAGASLAGASAVGGENEGYAILSSEYAPDILIGGHQHQTFCGNTGRTVYTETRDEGVELAVIDIDTESGKITAEIRKAEAEADEEIISLCKEEEDACQRWLDEPLGRSEVDLTVKDEMEARREKAQLITFLNQVQMEQTHAQLSGVALFEHATGFSSVITMRDVVATYSFPNTLTVKRVSGKVLREYLEQSGRFWTEKDGRITVSDEFEKPVHMYFNYDCVDGIDYMINVRKAPGSRITSLSYQGEPVSDDQQFTLVVNNYRASGGGNFPMLSSAPTVLEDQTSMVDVIAEYIMKKKVIRFEPVHNIRVVAE